MLIENLTGKVFSPEMSAPYAIKAGARVSGGTDMRLLSSCVVRDYGLEYTTANHIETLTDALYAGAIAIAHVGGDRDGYKGVFSNSGHFIVVLGIRGNQLIILDPYLKDGKYSAEHRKVVTVDGNILLAAVDVLKKDAENRSPRYYIFKA